MNSSHDVWAPPECGEDEDYVEYLGRAADYYRDNPPPAGEHITLTDCDAEPRHWPTYEVKTDDFYPGYCLYCQMDTLRKELNARECRMHWRDHPLRGRIALRVCGWAYSMGIITGYGISGGGPTRCRRCITGIRFRGRRPYILGKRRGDV
jgi:hypothetical protein